jgi:MFS family permease
MLRNINAVAFPELVGTFDLGPDALGLLSSAYFVGFASCQLPLGMLLDRYGPRRVNASLLLVAAAGILVFAAASDLTQLTFGRTLMGLGFAGGLMSSMTAFILWFERSRMATLSGWMLAVGAAGAYAATVPVELALRVIPWRAVFVFLGLAVVVAALLIQWRVPERKAERASASWPDQWRNLASIYSSTDFWRVALVAASTQGAALALLGLWAGPWLRDVAGLERAAVAEHLAVAALAFGGGGIVFGTLSDGLARRGIDPERTFFLGCAMTVLTLLPIALGFSRWPMLTWSLFIACSASGALAYPLLTARFPPAIAGRVLTGVNVVMMLGAFAFQAGVGAIIGQWPVIDGRYAQTGYRIALVLVVALQALSLVWAGCRRAAGSKPAP